MTIQEALANLHALPDQQLTAAEKAQLDEKGYLFLPDVLNPAQIADLGRRLDLLMQLEGSDAGKEVHQEAGTDRLANLVSKGKAFEVFFTHPKFLAAVAHVLNGDMRLSAINSRAGLPGQGLQGLHADWGPLEEKGNYQVCNSVWPIDDFTAENGATRIVPGSHRSGKAPHEAMANPADPHPDELVLIAPAGTVVVFNAHLWHGGTLNRTNRPRRAIFSYFCRRHVGQQTNQRKYLSHALIEAFTPEMRCILDV